MWFGKLVWHVYERRIEADGALGPVRANLHGVDGHGAQLSRDYDTLFECAEALQHTDKMSVANDELPVALHAHR